jgi:hypothetical protein
LCSQHRVGLAGLLYQASVDLAEAQQNLRDAQRTLERARKINEARQRFWAGVSPSVYVSYFEAES